jgi:catechol 2,3-dioxygenase-like lactoylglutathione lyase family enzyme
MIKGGVASIYVNDMDRALAFYEGVLGLSLRVRIENEWAELEAGPTLTLGLHLARPPVTVAAGTAGAVNAELHISGTMEDAVATLQNRGAALDGEIHDYEHVRIAAVRDPDGNSIVLAQVLG